MEASEPRLSQFLRTYGAKNIFNGKIYFKGKTKASCIDVLITSNPKVQKYMRNSDWTISIPYDALRTTTYSITEV